LVVERRPPHAQNTSISLGDHFSRFVDRQLEEGRYGSASEVVRAGLRLLEEHEAKVKALQQALIEGEQSGPPAPFDNEAFLKRMREKHAG
jgi:antitoxin ParD1/3/4